MAFFDKKQEVIDVKLTQFGKNLLARGYFKPVFYQFFDDDILYNSNCAAGSEHQNAAESRILEETPRLKTIHITMPVEERYSFEEEMIQSGDIDRFQKIKKTVFPHIQERILLYPLSNQNIETQERARFNIENLGTKITNLTLSELTGSGIQKKSPVLEMAPKYLLKEIRENLLPESERRIISDETYTDITSNEVTFSDNSKLIVEHDKVVLDVQELNCFTGFENFYLNIYEVVETEETDRLLKKLDTFEKINKYFVVKTDEDVEEKNSKDHQSNNYYKRGEN